jgi:L-threo-3-deoxy-hexylosonate aldolase
MTSLGRGVFVPVPTFFKENEDVDLEAFDKHIEYLANSGIAGVVVLGSMGEAVNLSEEERTLVIKQASDSIKKYNPSLKLIAGTSAQSARTTILYTKQAKEAGASFTLILPPSFYKGSINHNALIQFYTTVANKSPLPIVIYNYPGVCQGLDLSVDLLVELSKHPNIIGVKGTDGNVGKMANLVNKTNPNGKCIKCIAFVCLLLINIIRGNFVSWIC